MSNDHLGTNNGLYFPPEVEWMRTPQRDRTVEFIHKTALELCDGRLKSAFLVLEHSGEEDSELLCLSLRVDSDWEFIQKLRYNILARVGEWMREEFSEEEKSDCRRRVDFSLYPTLT